jgi:hypothetical protein
MKRSLLVGVVLTVLALPGNALAAPRASGCAGSWDGTGDECSFAYSGGSVYVSMSVLGSPFGGGVVRLERPNRYGGRDVVLSCVAAGMWSGCASSMSSDGPVAAVDSTLFCVVQARGGSGAYSCGSEGTPASAVRVSRRARARRHK